MMPTATNMTKAEAAEILRRVRNGEPLRNVVYSKGGFSQFRFKRYRRTHPAYDRKLSVVAEARLKEAIRGALVRRSAGKTHCKRGHLLEGENVGWKMSHNSVKPGRFCRVCAREDAQKIRPMTAEKVQRVVDLVNQNVPMNKIYGGGSTLYVTAHQNIEFQRVIDPAFNRLITNHLDRREERRLATIYRRILPPTVTTFDNSEYFSRFTDEDYRRLLARVPRDVPAERRCDVAHDVIAALREGRIPPEGIGLFMRRFVTANNIASGATRRILSLDEIRGERGNRTLHDALSQGVWA